MASSVVYIPLLMMTFVMLMADSTARELRPSIHGLEFQSTPPLGDKSSPSPEMKAFFQAGPPTSTSSDVAIPKAMNSNTTSWWSGQDGGSGHGGGGDRLRHVLLVTSLACGIAGVALFGASAVVYFVRRRRQRSPPPGNIDGNTNTSK